MHESKVQFFKKPAEDIQRLEPSTCTEAETFVLQVLDDSMEPEFAKHCMIVIDPTGHARDGSYVLARRSPNAELNSATENSATENSATENSDDARSAADEQVEQFHFRQLRLINNETWQLCSLNDAYPSEETPSDFSEIVGVIVQRAGTRRRYHKRYD